MTSQTPYAHIQAFHSLQTVNQVMQFIIEAFQFQLKVNQLQQYLPLINANTLHKLNQQCISYFYLQSDSRSTSVPINQDFMPITTPTDSLTTFHIKLEENEEQKLDKSKTMNQSKSQFLQTHNKFNSTKKSSHQIQENNTLNYSMSQSQQNPSLKTSNLQNEQSEILISNSQKIQVQQFKEQSVNKHSEESSLQLNKKQLNSSDLLPLNLKSDPIDLNLQNELEHVKKHLYMMRRYRKIGIEEERERVDNMKKKKSHLFFNKGTQHTYEYDGSLIQFKKLKDSNQKELVQQIRPNLLRNSCQRDSVKNKNHSKRSSMASTSLDYTQQNSLMENALKIEENNPERNLNSQQKLQKVSFSNENNRQVSHLPFIALKDNTKIIENKKELSGFMTQRTSLNRSKISELSSESNKFKSFARIEQQKRLQKSRQKVLELTQSQSNEFFQVDIMPPTLNLNLNSEPLRKQSKMMQKYLRKLTEQKSRIEKLVDNEKGSKSINFQQLKVPQKYPIQRYYEYDYEQERQNYEYEITSKLSSKRNSINETECN